MQSLRGSVRRLGESGQGIRECTVVLRSGVLVHEAARGLAWPIRLISSLVLAPVDAAKVFPVCLKS